MLFWSYQHTWVSSQCFSGPLVPQCWCISFVLRPSSCSWTLIRWDTELKQINFGFSFSKNERAFKPVLLNMTCPWVFLYLACDSAYVWRRGPTKGVFQSLQTHYSPQQMSNSLGSLHIYNDLKESNCGALQEKGNTGDKNQHSLPQGKRDPLLNNFFPDNTRFLHSPLLSWVRCLVTTWPRASKFPFFFVLFSFF